MKHANVSLCVLRQSQTTLILMRNWREGVTRTLKSVSPDLGQYREPRSQGDGPCVTDRGASVGPPKLLVSSLWDISSTVQILAFWHLHPY